MSTAQYNELTHEKESWGHPDDPMYTWNSSFPEKFSRLRINELFGSPSHGPQRRGRVQARSRYRTQPVTFIEIQEAEDEETSAASQKLMTGADDEVTSSKSALWSQFEEFSRCVSSRFQDRDGSISRSDTEEQGSDAIDKGSPSTGSYLLQEYERRRKRSQRKKRGKSIEEMPETEKND